MSESTQDKIAFEVETARVLEILSKEIYDSPLALLRENVQNAYDAILMRCTQDQSSLHEATINLTIEPGRLVITDDGIGMTEEVLRNNFWKAGSSGKKTELARRSGVIGTFGIGAMANFGVCTKLRVETRAVGSDVTLISVAERAKLSFSQECIDLERVQDTRSAGTVLSAELDSQSPLTEQAAAAYLEPYVAFLPVRVNLNGRLISQRSYSGVVSRGFQPCGGKTSATSGYEAKVEVSLDSNGQVQAKMSNVKLQGVHIAGELLLVQNSGQLMGLRNHFGLAPVPVSGHYQLGGYANLSVLQPTAGREALSRESIVHVNNLVNLAETAITEIIAASDAADRNTSFQQYIVSHKRIDLGGKVTITALPDNRNVALSDIQEYCAGKRVFYYVGTDSAILQTFAGPESILLQVSQSNPRRKLQLQYVTQMLAIPDVPDKATVTKEYQPKDLLIEEASMLARVMATLSDDYLLVDVNVQFADITHGVPVLVAKEGDSVRIWLARNSSMVKPVIAAYRTAFEVFGGFVKDFVRNHLYQRVSDYVPSSTREGAEALARVLQRNRELYRYEENELGDLEPLLGDYLAGDITLAQVLSTAKSSARPFTQTVRQEQIGSLEEALPDVVKSGEDDTPEPNQEFEPTPAILREEVSCSLKILTTNGKYRQLNNYEMFLGLSDRLVKREGEFFRYPHTTKIIWAGHRIIYIFTEASGKITLYYDIELREPLEEKTASGAMFPTTTLVLKNRIYVPVPQLLQSAFKLVNGAKEFYVRFDTIISI